jgi:hypothetical protein
MRNKTICQRRFRQPFDEVIWQVFWFVSVKELKEDE